VSTDVYLFEQVHIAIHNALIEKCIFSQPSNAFKSLWENGNVPDREMGGEATLTYFFWFWRSG